MNQNTGKAVGMVFDVEKKMFSRVDIEFDLETNEAKIVNIEPVGDSRAMAIFNARKFIVLNTNEINMLKPQKGENND